jgi:heptose I phosphotransferase
LSDTFHVSASYQPIVRELGLDAEAIFTDPRIAVWRSIRERENCTLEADLVDGRHFRWHIKRHQPVRGRVTPAEEEARGVQLLQGNQIPTVTVVGWGVLGDRRSFVITEDLEGFDPADKLIGEAGLPFDALLEPTAHLAASLHSKGLHHRDLYLCHFFVRPSGGSVADLRLIDAARVKTLPKWLGRRWIIKDLAQFWYSTLSLGITDEQRERWLARYAEFRPLAANAPLAMKAAIGRKASWIARHDARLRSRQPGRNVSIPRG